MSLIKLVCVLSTHYLASIVVNRMASAEDIRLFTISSEVPEAKSLHKTAFVSAQVSRIELLYTQKVFISTNFCQVFR